MPRKKTPAPETYNIGKRPHLHVPYRCSPEIKDLAKAMTSRNVEAVAALVYTTDGDIYEIYDIGRLAPHDVAADLQALMSKFT